MKACTTAPVVSVHRPKLRARTFAALATVLLAACGNPAKGPTPVGTGAGAGSGSASGGGTSPAMVDNITLADAGLEADSLDRKADPCVDFFQFACGGWLAKHPIPDDRSSWSRFAEIDDSTETVLRAILEDAAAGKLGTGEPATKVGAFYGSCMDEAAIEKKGTKAIKPLLTRAGKVRDAKTWFAMVLELQKLGVNAVWSVATESDFANSTQNALWLESGGLSLPDRDYYTEAKFKDKVDAFRAHLVRMFGLLGKKPAQAAAAADAVIAIETQLASVTKTGVERRDIPGMYNPKKIAELSGLTASIDWKAYFKGLGIDPGPQVIVASPKFFQALDGLRKATKPAAWQAYFTYQLISSSAFAVGKKYDDEMFALRQALTGVKQPRERYKRCIDATTGAMPEYVGQPYVERAFPGESKQAAIDLVDAIFASMDDRLGKLDWMTATTQAAARDKLKKLARMIGYPDKWMTYDFAVKRDDFVGNAMRADTFETRRQLAKAGKPYDRNEWLMGAYEVNAYYNPAANNTALPAGILQPPFFGVKRSVAANLGGIGMVIGHELTHGFDDQGAQFDAEGNMKDWWLPADKTAFEAKGKCVAKQYSTFEVLPGQFVNGDLTLGENIADLGGVKMAFYAYRALRSTARPAVADGFTEDQQFFLGAGQAWCGKYRKEEQQNRLTTDVHSPAKFRVYGAMRNLPEFATAFNCAAGTPMKPANSCAVW